jgi:TonB family protein
MTPKIKCLGIEVLLSFSCLLAFTQTSSKKSDEGREFSQEGVVIENMETKVSFESDGSSTREQKSRVRIQSDAGVRQYGTLRPPYVASVETIEVLDVRVIKPNGTVVATPLDSIQDAPSELYRGVPEFTDLREKHIAVKGLEPNDILEYSIRWQITQPLAPGQFWFAHSFLKSTIVLDERLEISVPREREVKQKSKTVQPTVREENNRRIYSWKDSNLESQNLEKQEDFQKYALTKGLFPAPDVLISSFHSWEEVGRWYEGLQKDKIQPSPEVRVKAEDLTKGLPNDDAKLRAIYNYVSLRYRYVGIALGIGRYQPHSAAEILGNQYGDCKDKHTLLAALLNAVGIHVYPALISSRASVDLDVPSPGQFDHVISAVTKGNTLLWMDVTPEVTPIGYLVYPLRGKPALLIAPDKVEFRTTPVNPPFANTYTNKVTGKIDATGVLQAHVDATYRGEDELLYRNLFRRIPESQWKAFGQQNFQGARLGGTVTDVTASPPEKTDEPFVVSYDYTLRDFSGGEKHRFVIPLSSSQIPVVKDQDLDRTIPLWIGYVGEYNFESRIQLPGGWSVAQKAPIDLNESFAEYQSSSELRGGVLITKRHLALKAYEVTPEQLKSYRSFRKAISDDEASYVFLQLSADLATTGPVATPVQGIARGIDLVRQAVLQLPGSSNSDALQAEQDARRSLQTKDYQSAIVALKRAVSLDSTFSRAWIELGITNYGGMRDGNAAFGAFQKAIEADPKQVIPYKILAFMYVGVGKKDEAILTWQKLQKVAPDDRDLSANLGVLYMTQKRYSEATALFESEAKAHPSDALPQLHLGVVRLRSHNTDQGIDALHKALEIDSGAEMLNNVAYELVEADTHLPDALTYSQRSVKEVEDRSLKLDLEHLGNQDRLLPMMITSYWDTLGWIYFKMGDLAQAESYLNAAWQLGEDGVVGDHLGQVYEKERKLPIALHMYNLALEANPRLEDTPARMRNLANVPLPKNRMSAGEELSVTRTIKLPVITKEHVNADFDVLIVSGRIERVSFASGSELLRGSAETIKKASFEEPLPANSTAHLLRRGALSCAESICSFVFYPLSVAVTKFTQNNVADVHDVPPTPLTGEAPAEVFHVGGSITPPRSVFSPEPQYTEQARKSNLQGTCTLGLIVEKDGHPSHIRLLKGIGMGLDENAIEAVKTWKFEPALKDGQPVRVEIAVEVSFRLYQRSGHAN